MAHERNGLSIAMVLTFLFCSISATSVELVIAHCEDKNNSLIAICKISPACDRGKFVQLRKRETRELLKSERECSNRIDQVWWPIDIVAGSTEDEVEFTCIYDGIKSNTEIIDSFRTDLPTIKKCQELLVADKDWSIAYEELWNALIAIFACITIISIVLATVWTYFWKRGNLRRTFFGLMCIVFSMKIPLAKMSRVAPLVPDVLVWALEEIELEPLIRVKCIYRSRCVKGDEVKCLRRMLVSRKRPNLGGYRVHIFTGVVRYILRNLREPLLPIEIWESMVEMVNNRRSLIPIVHSLPDAATRATLARMMIHLLRIKAHASVNELDAEALGAITASMFMEIPDGSNKSEDRKISDHKIAIIVSFLDESEQTWEQFLRP